MQYLSLSLSLSEHNSEFEVVTAIMHGSHPQQHNESMTMMTTTRTSCSQQQRKQQQTSSVSPSPSSSSSSVPPMSSPISSTSMSSSDSHHGGGDHKRRLLVVLNNNAVATLQLGQTIDACKLLTEASSILAQIKVKNSTATTTSNTTTTTTTGSTSPTSSTTVTDHHSSQHHHHHHQQQQQEQKIMLNEEEGQERASSCCCCCCCRSSSPTNFFWVDLSNVYTSHAQVMFQRAIVIDDEEMMMIDDGPQHRQDLQDQDDNEDRSDRSAYSLCWVVLYNLGLACHLLACQSGASAEGRQHFHRAKGLYDILYNDYVHHVPTGMTTTFLLALYYNQGHIYTEFASHELAATCLRCVQLLLIKIRYEQPTMNMRETELNLILLRPPATAGAA
jgi:hypothetical protein